MSDDASPRILIVDDEIDACVILAEYLQACGYATDLAHDGEEAIGALGKSSYGLVISDVDMPRKSGLDLLRHIRGTHPELPVILITGHPGIDNAITSMRLGAADYVAKPFDLKHLRDTVAKLMPVGEETIERTMVLPNTDREINGFVVRRLISEGNMGAVYLAERGGQRYALKLIRSGLSDEAHRRELLERFIREAEVAAHIVHENIVKIIDYGYSEHDMEPYLVMEYIDGLPLNVVSKQLPPTDYAARVQLLRQVAAALAAIHERGVCHRDIKPGNILVDSKRHVTLTDFGVARVPGSELTVEDQILGSPLYMAPESFATAQVDARADLFSLGIVSYEFLLGRLPFEGGSLPSIANQICDGRAPSPRKLQRNFPVPLQDILATLLKKSPQDRFQGAGEVIAAFDAFLTPNPSWQRGFQRLTKNVFIRDDWA